MHHCTICPQIIFSPVLNIFVISYDNTISFLLYNIACDDINEIESNDACAHFEIMWFEIHK